MECPRGIECERGRGIKPMNAVGYDKRGLRSSGTSVLRVAKN